MKKIIYFVAIALLAVSCAQEPFQGKISYEGEVKTILGEKMGFIDNILGSAMNSTVDLYIKDGKAMMITEQNNQIFQRFHGEFTKVIWDFTNQQMMVVNDEEKVYTQQNLLDSDIENFYFKDFKSQLDSAKKALKSTGEIATYAQSQCKIYEVDGMIMDGKIGLSQDLLDEMKPTWSKIEGLENYDMTGLGFPLFYEVNVAGLGGMSYTASRIERKELEESLFSLDGYRKIDQLEFYEKYIEQLPFEELGLGEQVDALKLKGDSLMNGMVDGIGAEIDSVLKDINVGGLLDDLFGGSSNEN